MFSFESLFGEGRGGGFGEPSDEEAVDTEGLYKVLNVDKHATEREIKKAYKKAALKHHPDRGGDAEKFKEVEKAKQILTDPQKRKLYDKYGEKGVERGGGGRADIFDMFSGRHRQDRGPPKPKTITQTVDITLEDVYKGSAIKRKWKIKTATRRYNCTRCKGQGSVTQVIRQGPMMMQTQRQCDSCRGRGFSLPDEKEVERKGTVHIPHGIKNGGKILLHGEGHSLPEYQKGDVAFIVRLKKHNVYHRKGADLGCGHTLTLCEALCGYEFRLKHVSGKTLIIKSRPGEIVQPGDLKVLKDFGLPQKGNHIVHGHLYIKFNVVFPVASSLSNDKKTILENALKEVAYPDVVEKIELGKGSRVKVHLSVSAAVKICRQRRKMTVLGMIVADKMIVADREEAESWQVELDAIDGIGERRTVVVPADWVEAVDEGRRSSRSEKKNKKKTRKRNINSMQEDVQEGSFDYKEDDYEDEEDVFLETVVGGTPKPTPAQGGSIHDEDEDERQHGGVQCQQM